MVLVLVLVLVPCVLVLVLVLVPGVLETSLLLPKIVTSSMLLTAADMLLMHRVVAECSSLLRLCNPAAHHHWSSFVIAALCNMSTSAQQSLENVEDISEPVPTKRPRLSDNAVREFTADF